MKDRLMALERENAQKDAAIQNQNAVLQNMRQQNNTHSGLASSAPLRSGIENARGDSNSLSPEVLDYLKKQNEQIELLKSELRRNNSTDIARRDSFKQTQFDASRMPALQNVGYDDRIGGVRLIIIYRDCGDDR